jgi:RNA polymerase sigma-70 factor (ECF subfamily)
MRFADGLTQTEIAEALGIPLGTVKSWMGRGLARLRATMERPQ